MFDICPLTFGWLLSVNISVDDISVAVFQVDPLLLLSCIGDIRQKTVKENTDPLM